MYLKSKIMQIAVYISLRMFSVAHWENNVDSRAWMRFGVRIDEIRDPKNDLASEMSRFLTVYIAICRN